jgi:hypothetical protein
LNFDGGEKRKKNNPRKKKRKKEKLKVTGSHQFDLCIQYSNYFPRRKQPKTF